MSADLPPSLPGGALLLHIGPHKTGSTAIQAALHGSRELLAAHGVHYAGRSTRPRRPVWSLGVRGRPSGTEKPPERRWTDFLEDEIRTHDGETLCLSNEDLGRATEDQIDRVVGDLGGEQGAERVHVVAVARRLDRYLPSQWQERVKGGEARTFDAWLRDVLTTTDSPASWDERGPDFSWERVNVWYAHDTAALVRRWSRAVDPSRITVVVGDDRNARLLPDTFESLLGLPLGSLELVSERSNRGLVWAETELVRAFNERMVEAGLARPQIRRWSGRTLVPALSELESADDGGPRTPPFPSWAAEQVRERSEARIRGLREVGVRFVGDVDSLRIPEPMPVDDVATAPPPSTATAAALLATLALKGDDAPPG